MEVSKRKDIKPARSLSLHWYKLLIMVVIVLMIMVIAVPVSWASSVGQMLYVHYL